MLVAVYCQSRQAAGETQTFSFAPKRRPDPRAAAPASGGCATSTGSRLVAARRRRRDRCRSSSPSRRATCSTRRSSRSPSARCRSPCSPAGPAALPRPDGVRRHRRAARRGVHRAASTHRHRLARHPLHQGRASSRCTFGRRRCSRPLITAALAALIGAGALRVPRPAARGEHVRVRPSPRSQYLYHRPILSGGQRDSVPFPAATSSASTSTDQRTVLLRRARRARRRGASIVARLRAHRRRPHHDRRARQPRQRRGATRSRRAGEAPRVRPGRAASPGSAVRCSPAPCRPFPLDRFFTVERLAAARVAIVVIGGLGSVVGPGPRRAVGRSACRVLPRQRPRAAVHLERRPARAPALLPGRAGADRLLGSRLHSSTGPSGGSARRRPKQRPRRTAAGRRGRARPTARRAGRAVLGPPTSPCASAASSPSTTCRIEVGAGEIVGLIGTNGAGKSTLMNAIGGFVPSARTVELLGDDVTERTAGRTRPHRPRPHVPGRDAVPRAHRARDGAGRARGPRPHRHPLDRAAASRRRSGVERATRAEADELIDFLGLGRYADTLHRRPLHRHPPHRRARRAARARRPRALPRRAHRRRRPARDRGVRAPDPRDPPRARRVDARHRARHAADHAHQRPRVLPRGWAASSPRARPTTVRNDPAVVASYLGTDERAIARSGAVAEVADVETVVLGEV